jgi:hypothetical protein
MRRPLAFAALLLSLTVTSTAGAEVRLEKVGDFAQPVYVTGAPGDSDRLYVVERRGTIQVYEHGTVSQFLDLSDAVRGPGDPDAGTEEGLLSMAFAPDFETSRLLYVYFTDADGEANVVEELRAPTDDAADPASRRRVIAIAHRGSAHHNGGQLQFGPDGMLYLAPGDGGTGGAPARDMGSLLGKLLRIDPRGSAPGEYSVPGSNPFVGMSGHRGAIWAYGLRNPFRFSFDRLTGDLTIGDVGEKTTEEIDFLPNATGRGHGANLGWNVCEGSFLKGDAGRLCTLPGAVVPALDKSHIDGYKAIMNGYVVRDPSLPSLYGRFVYGDFYVDALRTAVLGPGGASDDREIGPQAQLPRIASFGEDAGGCVYASSYNGGVYRLVEDDVRIPCAAVAPATPPRPTAPVIQTSLASSPSLRRGGPFAIHAECSSACRLRTFAAVYVRGRAYWLSGRRIVVLSAGIPRRIAWRLTPPARTALHKALARGGTPYVRLGVTGRGVDGAWPQASPVLRSRVTR